MLTGSILQPVFDNFFKCLRLIWTKLKRTLSNVFRCLALVLCKQSSRLPYLVKALKEIVTLLVPWIQYLPFYGIKTVF